MTHRAILVLLALPLFAQTPPDLTGVWRAKLTDYLVIITQKGSAITVKTLIVRTPANTRNEATYDPSVAQTSNWIRGNPTKSHAAWEGSTLKIASSYTFAGALQSYQDEWTLAPDGTLSLVHTQAPAPVTKVIFEKWLGGGRSFASMPPDLGQMLAHHDAGLIIGDPALLVYRSR